MIEEKRKFHLSLCCARIITVAVIPPHTCTHNNQVSSNCTGSINCTGKGRQMLIEIQFCVRLTAEGNSQVIVGQVYSLFGNSRRKCRDLLF